MVNAINSGKIDIVTHPFHTDGFPIDMEKIEFAKACKRNVLLEFNLEYIRKHIINEKSAEHLANIKEMVMGVKKYGKKLIVGSDAHNIMGTS